MRTNKKTVTKNYDEDTVNGWNVAYEYESQDGAAPVEYRANCNIENGSAFIIKQNGSTSASFSGSRPMDTDLITAVTSEFDVIAATFE